MQSIDKFTLFNKYYEYMHSDKIKSNMEKYLDIIKNELKIDLDNMTKDSVDDIIDYDIDTKSNSYIENMITIYYIRKNDIYNLEKYTNLVDKCRNYGSVWTAEFQLLESIRSGNKDMILYCFIRSIDSTDGDTTGIRLDKPDIDISELEKYFDFSKPYHEDQTFWTCTEGNIVIPPARKNYKEFQECEDEEDLSVLASRQLHSWTKTQKKILFDRLNIE